MYDLVIKGAEVADGTGAPLRTADVAVKDGRISEVGKLNGGAKESVDGDGLVLAPGIVDVHTHYDAQLTWDSNATPSPSMGVTTVVVGNCGFSIAPCPPDCRDLIARNLAEVEGMSLTALRSGTNWDFESFDEYLALLRRKGVTPNVAAFIGHSAVRTMVMGPEASERAAREDEVAEMRDLVRGGIDAAGQPRDHRAPLGPQPLRKGAGHAGAERGGVARAHQRHRRAHQWRALSGDPEKRRRVIDLCKKRRVARLAQADQPRAVPARRRDLGLHHALGADAVILHPRSGGHAGQRPERRGGRAMLGQQAPVGRNAHAAGAQETEPVEPILFRGGWEWGVSGR